MVLQFDIKGKVWTTM